jgi:hypothetical protein
MVRWLSAVVGVLFGGAVGLFGPVLLLAALHIGSGSYEDVLALWLVALPLGVVGGGAVGHRLGRGWEARRARG